MQGWQRLLEQSRCRSPRSRLRCRQYVNNTLFFGSFIRGAPSDSQAAVGVCSPPTANRNPFFPFVFTGGGWQRGAAQAARRAQRGRGHAWSGQVPATWGGLVARASGVAPRLFLTKVWLLAAGCTKLPLFLVHFYYAFSARKVVSWSDSSYGPPKSIFSDVCGCTSCVVVGCPHMSPLRWGPVPRYQSGQPRTAACSRHKRDLHRERDLHRRPGDHASRSALSEPAALQLSALIFLSEEAAAAGTPRDINAGTVNERCNANSEAHQLKPSAWGGVGGLAAGPGLQALRSLRNTS